MSVTWHDWSEAERDLGLELIEPFDVKIGDEITVHAQFLVKNFGHHQGMLVFTNFDTVEPYGEQLWALGYGLTVLEKPVKEDLYDRDVFIEVLSDWGWSGDSLHKPCWLKPKR
jgi:hypothetical protein